MDPPMQVDTTPTTTEHSLPAVEEAYLDRAISTVESSMKNKRRLFRAVSVAVILAVIIGVSVGISSRKSKSSSAAGVTSGDDNEPRFEEVKDFLTFLTPKAVLEEEGTPQNKAAKWVADEDVFRLRIPESTEYDESFHFFQRYILAVFYHALDGPNWDHQMQFLTETSVCNWNYELKTRDPVPGTDQNDWILGVQCNGDKEVEHIFMRK